MMHLYKKLEEEMSRKLNLLLEKHNEWFFFFFFFFFLSLKTTCKIEGNALIQDQKGSPDSILSREVKDGKMHMVSFM